MLHNTRQSNKGYHNIRHNTIRIYTKCPGCLLNSKQASKIKIHKTLSSLDSHISTQHKDEFWVKQVQLLIRQFSKEISK